MDTPAINMYQRMALLALIDVESARVAVGQRERRAARHRLFALIRERYGEKYTKLPPEVFRETAHWLIDGPLDSVDTPQENGYL